MGRRLVIASVPDPASVADSGELPKTVIPAKAGTHFDLAVAVRERKSESSSKMGSGFRRNDGDRRCVGRGACATIAIIRRAKAHPLRSPTHT